MKVEKIRLEDIILPDYNPRIMSEEEKEKLKNSIKEFGFVEPIVYNIHNHHVIGGNQRVIVYDELEYEEIDAVVVDIEDINEEMALNIALNKIQGTWDHPKLEVVMENLTLEGYNLELTGFNKQELLELKTPKEAIEDDYNFEEEIEPIVQYGDIWQLGNHRLMCGDSTKKEDVEQLVNNNIIDLLFTDPPYGVSYADKNAFLNAVWPANRIQDPIEKDHGSLEEMKEVWLQSFTNAINVVKKGACYYICSPQGGELMMMMMMILQAGWELKHTIIWVKNNHVIGRSDYNYKHEPLIYGWKEGGHKFYGETGSVSVWEIPKPQKSDLHPTMKPIKLSAKAIQNSSLNGELVLDLFGGSGTTLIACEQLDRNCYMMEIDTHYCDVIIDRWEQYTGKKAEKI